MSTNPRPTQAVSEVRAATNEILNYLDDLISPITERLKKLMALTQAESDALKGISTELGTISTDVDTLVTAAKDHNDAQQKTIDAQTATITELTGKLGADDQSVIDLTAQRDALQTQVDTHSSEVVTALGDIQTAADELDKHVKSLAPPPSVP